MFTCERASYLPERYNTKVCEDDVPRYFCLFDECCDFVVYESHGEYIVVFTCDDDQKSLYTSFDRTSYILESSIESIY